MLVRILFAVQEWIAFSRYDCFVHESVRVSEPLLRADYRKSQCGVIASSSFLGELADTCLPVQQDHVRVWTIVIERGPLRMAIITAYGTYTVKQSKKGRETHLNWTVELTNTRVNRKRVRTRCTLGDTDTQLLPVGNFIKRHHDKLGIHEIGNAAGTILYHLVLPLKGTTKSYGRSTDIHCEGVRNSTVIIHRPANTNVVLQVTFSHHHSLYPRSGATGQYRALRSPCP